MSTKILLRLAVFAVVGCVAPHHVFAQASSYSNDQVNQICNDEWDIQQNVTALQNLQQQFDGGLPPPAQEQATLSEIDAALNSIISDEQDQLSIMQASGDPQVGNQQGLITNLYNLLAWENQDFSNPYPPTATGVVSLSSQLAGVLLFNQGKLNWIIGEGEPLAGRAVYEENITLTQMYQNESANLALFGYN
jgi:hypothetical protein